MSNNKSSLTTVITSLALLLCVNIAYIPAVSAQTRQLPITYFTDRVASNRSGVSAWQDPISGNVLQIDRLGRQNARFGLNLPTIVGGGVNITTLKDGTERVVVDIDTANALCWGSSFNEDLGFLPAFGYRPTAVFAGQGTASLGTTREHLVFAPQPAGQFDTLGILESIRATVMCDGELRAESGYMAGAAGRAQTTQIALFNTGVRSGCPLEGDADCFPAERVQFIPTGK